MPCTAAPRIGMPAHGDCIASTPCKETTSNASRTPNLVSAVSEYQFLGQQKNNGGQQRNRGELPGAPGESAQGFSDSPQRPGKQTLQSRAANVSTRWPLSMDLASRNSGGTSSSSIVFTASTLPSLAAVE